MGKESSGKDAGTTDLCLGHEQKSEPLGKIGECCGNTGEHMDAESSLDKGCKAGQYMEGVKHPLTGTVTGTDKDTKY